ncbi:fimbrial protein [Enterobacter asburiae]|uniref:fimbrial protein n=1 Tax=Enterobacter asburiae TaxID=61645 RepID=UPI000A2699CB|nr:fimbrial protein [Enterobacter asburiae]
MKINKVASALILSMGMVAFGANAADQGSGSVTFTGSIIDAPCSIAPDSVDQEVSLGQVAKNALMNGGKSNPAHFDIKLENCVLSTDEAAKNTVTITFNGAAADTAKNLLKIEGTAEGAGVGITDPNGKQVTLGKATDAIALTNAATNSLDLYGFLEGMDDTKLKEGSYQAISHFTMDYQ